jgi:hypothetical protein
MPERPVKLINDQESLTLKVGATTFMYRRIKPLEKAAINKTYTRAGVIDFTEAGLEYIKKCLKGWENVRDGKNKQVPFDIGLVDSLPENVLIQLVTAITGTEELFEKNSLTEPIS